MSDAGCQTFIFLRSRTFSMCISCTELFGILPYRFTKGSWRHEPWLETRTLAEPWLKCSNIHLLNTSENAVHRGIYFMNTSEDGMYRGIYSMKTPEQEKFSGVQQNFRGVYFMKTSEKEMIFEESQMNTFENQLFITNCLFNEPLLSLHSPIM